MEDYQLRVVEEKRELDSKIDRLQEFITTSKFENLEENHQNLIVMQLQWMRNYSEILGFRIADFLKQNESKD